jgi:hypothetical protein
MANLALCHISESQEPDNDDQPVGGAVLEGLQAPVGPGGSCSSRRGHRVQYIAYIHLQCIRKDGSKLSTEIII